MPTVIFDLDGTLADTSADLIAAANACFLGLGFGQLLDPQKDASTAFRGGRAMLRLGLERSGAGVSETIIDEQFPALLDHYAAGIDNETTLYPGVVEAVQNLLDAGYKTGICTNKPEGLANDLVARLGIDHLFASLVGADTLPTRKPDPAPFIKSVVDAGGSGESSLLVGDTSTDRDTAKAAGVPCVLVTFGPDGEGVRDLEPEGLLYSYDQLEAVVAPLLRA